MTPWVQHELTEPAPLLDVRGHLVCPGWSRRPVFDANLECAAPGLFRRWRVKRWDYYGIWTPELFAAASLADLGYAGLAFVYVVDLGTGRHVEQTRIRLPPRRIDLPRSSETGAGTFDDSRLSVRFAVKAGAREVGVAAPSFDHGEGLFIDVVLDEVATPESMVIATPMGGDRFYYNRKINCLPARGQIRWGDRSIDATPNHTLGQLDWGRGVWPYRSHWIWASANGFLPNGRTIGLNLGGGFGDLSHATENALILGGRVHKLAHVDFEFDATNYRAPWRCTDRDGRLAVTFVPQIERVAKTNLGIIRSGVHQVFGRYHGAVVTDDGARVEVNELPGFAEEHHARW